MLVFIMMKNIALYSTSHCHLCDQAETMLKGLQCHYKFNYQVIEISENNTFLNLYELKIPVLKELDSQTEMNWPFDESDIKRLLF